MIRLKKGISPRCWEYLVGSVVVQGITRGGGYRASQKILVCFQILAIIGEQFFVGNEICGAVISIRPSEDIISVWNRTSSDRTVTDKIRFVNDAKFYSSVV